MAFIKKKIENLKPGKEYLLTVRSRDTNINAVSEFIDSIRFIVPNDLTIPDSVSNLELYSSLEAVMFVFDIATDPDIARYEYELYLYDDVEVVDGIAQLIEGAEPYRSGFSDANVFTVSVENLQQDDEGSGLAQYLGRVRAVDTSGNVGEWTLLAQTDTRTPLIDNQFIGSLTASKITAGTIGAHTITLNGLSSILKSSTFDGTAQIDGTTPNGFYTGVTNGWLINGLGNSYFANTSIRGFVDATDFNLIAEINGNEETVASLGPVDVPIVIRDEFGIIDEFPVQTSHSLVFKHLDEDFTDSSIVWTQNEDDSDNGIYIVGPSTNLPIDADPYFIASTNGYVNIYRNKDYTTPETLTGPYTIGGLKLNTGELKSSDTNISFADISMKSTSGTGAENSNGSRISIVADAQYGSQSYAESSIELGSNELILSGDISKANFIRLLASESINSVTPQETTSSSYILMTSKNLAAGLTLGTNFKIWDNGTVAVGPDSDTAPWTTGTPGITGFNRASMQVTENDSVSNATIGIRHTNRGINVNYGLDLVVRRADGTAYIIQREAKTLILRVSGGKDTLILSPTTAGAQILSGYSGTVSQPAYAWNGYKNSGLYTTNGDVTMSVKGSLRLSAQTSGVFIYGATDASYGSYSSWRVGPFGLMVSGSSSRLELKENINNIDSNWAISILNRLEPRKFNWKSTEKDDETTAELRKLDQHIGFIVEEVEAVGKEFGIQLIDYSVPRELLDQNLSIPPNPYNVDEDSLSVLSDLSEDDIKTLKVMAKKQYRQHIYMTKLVEEKIKDLDSWEPSYWREPFMITLCVAAIKQLTAEVNYLKSIIK